MHKLAILPVGSTFGVVLVRIKKNYGVDNGNLFPIAGMTTYSIENWGRVFPNRLVTPKLNNYKFKF